MEKTEKNTFQTIYDIVKQVPFGCVTTYGQVARLAGNPRLARVVGYALNVCTDPTVPCHRIVNRLGELADAFAPLGRESHRMLLELEGITFTAAGKVDLEKYLWDFAVGLT